MRRVLLAFIAAAPAVGFLAVPAAVAGEDDTTVTVREADTFSYPDVRLEVIVTGARPDPSDFRLRENGDAVRDPAVRPLAETAKAIGTVLVVDTSAVMGARGAMEATRGALRRFVEGMGPNESVALVSFSSAAALRSGFTQDSAVLLAAVDGLTAGGETAVWDGLVTAGGLLERNPQLQPNIMLVSGGPDTVSSASESQAISSVTGSQATVFAVASPGATGLGFLSGFVEATDGNVLSGKGPAGIGNDVAAIRAALENQYEVAYRSKGDGGSLTLELDVAGAAARVQTRAGTVGVSAAPEVSVGSPGPLGGTAGKGLLVLLATAAAGLLGFALLSIFGGRTALESRLAGYEAAEVITPGETLAPSPGKPSAGNAAQSAVRRAVDFTSHMAERAGVMGKVEAFLEQTNLPLRPAEALFFYGAGVFGVGLLAMVAAPSVPFALVVVAAAAGVPLLAVKRRRRKRLAAFEKLLPDTLNLLAGSLRAGYSFLQGVEAVAHEASEPMASELRRALAEARLGRPMEEALGDMAIRMESRDFDWAVMAIRIQREVGGNLAELLTTVADTMNQRTRLRGEIKALTAEGRMSAVVVGILPVAIGGFISVISPDYIATLFSSFVGWALVAGSIALALIGFVWLQKIVKIEV